ncbi:MFS transporter, PPP family, 3-phenylpropionic acid transporter [Anaerovirgula multivorans]|uniref:MFS transporter, PPP family, 3-phenylpropionic acid transporter n=1 Tax=Anaerovirgula multivorans TaxID=312168 RepID=A0A239HSR2_9FIRM|nr:MFS transporter [Anaerovirgula multivorans]SNS84251.1 MFS transporter, PPP family, 3-phenylpropionic acid transporter [Anaerovirgula multivorans]
MYFHFSIFYVLLYFALGAIYPLLSQYLIEIGLNGTEIGLITATGAVVVLLAQPIWGILCDKTQKTKKILTYTIAIAAALGIVLSFFQQFYVLLFGFAVLYFFQGANGPIIDGIVLNHTAKSNFSFGDVRQWGSIGFALAVFVAGVLGEKLGLKIIFYIYSLFYIVALFLIKPLPSEKSNTKVQLTNGVKKLLKTPQYTLLLISVLFVFGPMNGHNVYFALLFKYLGGGISGVGLAFLLFAGSEAPIMKIANKITNKIGIVNTLLGATIISVLRWFWYSTGPSYQQILWLFMLQGLSVGLLIVTGAQYASKNAPDELRMTAMTLYSSLGLGLGSIISKLLGGIILDQYNILAVYRFFGYSSLIGFIPLLIIKYRYESRKSETI